MSFPLCFEGGICDLTELVSYLLTLNIDYYSKGLKFFMVQFCVAILESSTAHTV